MQITKCYRLQIISTIQVASQIHITCFQVGGSLLIITVVFMSIKHQVDINYTETVKAKLTFERED